MTRFIDFNGTYINADTISSFSFTDDNKLIIGFKDESQRTMTAAVAPIWRDRILGARQIMQVIPCNAPVWQVWRRDGSYLADRVYFLALCADGSIKAINPQDGYLAVDDDDASTYSMGLYVESELSEFGECLEFADRFNPPPSTCRA